jgi:hypothetical protein
MEKEGLLCRQYKTKKKHCDAERLLTQSTTAEEEIEVMDQLAVEQLQMWNTDLIRSVPAHNTKISATHW